MKIERHSFEVISPKIKGMGDAVQSFITNICHPFLPFSKDFFSLEGGGVGSVGLHKFYILIRMSNKI